LNKAAQADMAKKELDLMEQEIKKRGVSPNTKLMGTIFAVKQLIAEGRTVPPETLAKIARGDIDDVTFYNTLQTAKTDGSVTSGPAQDNGASGEATPKAVDPNSARGQILAMLKQLDEAPDTVPEMVARKRALYADPSFQAYMKKQGFSDERIALKALRRDVSAKMDDQKIKDNVLLNGASRYGSRGPISTGFTGSQTTSPSSSITPPVGAGVSSGGAGLRSRVPAPPSPTGSPGTKPETALGSNVSKMDDEYKKRYANAIKNRMGVTV
jgi:hypothetical protein